MTLTGISQAKVESEGVPLGTALMQFNRWLKETEERHRFRLNRLEEGKEAGTVLTW